MSNNRGNEKGRAFIRGTKDAIQYPTIMTDTFPVNGLYATILFNSGAEKSFITATFRKLIGHNSRKLVEPYIVEMDKGELDTARYFRNLPSRLK